MPKKCSFFTFKNDRVSHLLGLYSASLSMLWGFSPLLLSLQKPDVVFAGLIGGNGKQINSILLLEILLPLLFQIH
jgi:hypothetical protein